MLGHDNKTFWKDLFLDLLIKQSGRAEHVVARLYSNGGWHQISGPDFCAHLGRACAYWSEALGNGKKSGSVVVIGRNTYSAFVCTLAAVLSGLDVFCLPAQMSKADVKSILEQHNGQAIATDTTEIAVYLKDLSYPVFDISSSIWMPDDSFSEPEALTQYRQKKKSNASDTNDEKKETIQSSLGHFYFMTFGHDGLQRAEKLNPNAMIVVAQKFLQQSKVPKHVFWKSFELMPPSNPFAHLSRFCVLLKNGIIGFPNTTTDLETNLHILRPSFLFASTNEMNEMCAFLQSIKKRKQNEISMKFSSKIDQINDLLCSSRAMKMPEKVFDTLKRSLRFSSRLIAGKEFLQQSVGDLQFIVHGLNKAKESHVKLFEKFGVPILESYGTTGSAGMLSCNEFHAPHFNTIGNPLAHVKFRLGDHSALEYMILHAAFEKCRQWEATGDVAQLTPFGTIITGRKRHLFITQGGSVVSPVRLEKQLQEFDVIAQACVIGDKMPYLSALIVLSPHVVESYKQNKQVIKDQIASIIGKINETLPRNTTIKKFKILESSFSETDGEKLSNGEINRIKIQQTRMSEIQSLYQ